MIVPFAIHISLLLAEEPGSLVENVVKCRQQLALRHVEYQLVAYSRILESSPNVVNASAGARNTLP